MRTRSAEFDVIVVGAGPAGSVTAEALAWASLRVALLEEHPRVGLPNQCSGLLSPRTLELAGVAEEVMGGVRFSSARVWSPGGKTLWLRSESVQAIAVDRARFDQILARRAAAAGATLLLGTQAYRFEQSERDVRVDARTGTGELRLRASLLVGADGARSQVARWMGREHKCEIIPAIKADVAFRSCSTDSIEIFVGNDVAPGWFGWVVPVGDGTARIGIGAVGTETPRHCFGTFLALVRQKFGHFAVREVKRVVLPLGPGCDFVADRVMLVGAAAQQTKPTTGGGIYFGMRAARLAAATAVEAVRYGDCSRRALAEYEQAWRRLDGRELAYERWLRQGFRCLSDKDFDLLIELLGEPYAQDLIARLGDVDFPSRLFTPLATALWKRWLPSQVIEQARHLVNVESMESVRA
jgi:geranylgeranyl reductase family protein